jgi:hypothetical protein
MPALVGAHDVVVLDAVALEEPVVPVIHADREVDDQLVLGLRQNHVEALFDLDGLGRSVELGLGDLIHILLLLRGPGGHTAPVGRGGTALIFLLAGMEDKPFMLGVAVWHTLRRRWP